MNSIFETANVSEVRTPRHVEERYGGLRIVVALLRVAGGAAMILSVIAALIVAFGDSASFAGNSFVSAVAILLCGGIGGLLVVCIRRAHPGRN